MTTGINRSEIPISGRQKEAAKKTNYFLGTS